MNKKKDTRCALCDIKWRPSLDYGTFLTGSGADNRECLIAWFCPDCVINRNQDMELKAAEIWIFGLSEPLSPTESEKLYAALERWAERGKRLTIRWRNEHNGNH